MSASSFPDSFDDSLPTSELTHPFNNGDSIFVEDSGPYNNNFADSDFVSHSVDDSAIFTNSAEDDSVLGSTDFPAENGGFVHSDAPILPPHDEMQEEGFALREWRRQNAIRLEEKEKREKEILSRIIEEANEFKVAFHEKRKTKCESNITNNREKEKLTLANIEKFHKEADKNYWKSIAELIPNEVPVIKKRGKKETEKKPSIAVIQGPKPGKPTDLARMRQILIKLKHDTPGHLKLAPQVGTSVNKDAESDTPPKTETVAATPAVVAA
ncbi:hypothetical protein RND81_08G211700 [Saponaria officinalis]|uniref:Clathrin light chain n=1 Tax=Saponaria officinalis TaxID=3572 RepID=A0AAW1JAI8_SAPOF